MKFNCLIVDDEPLARKVIREYLEETEDFVLLSEAKNVIEAQRAIDKGEVDVLFLDINMPKISGVDWIKGVQNKPTITIFTTAYSEYAVEAFEIEAFDYLVKPIALNRFLKTISKVRSRLLEPSKPQKSLKVKEGRRVYKIPIDGIFYLQAYGDYVKIHTEEKTYVVKQKLHAYLDLLAPDFQRIHRSYVINLNAIEYIEGNHVMINGVKIPISDTFKDIINSHF